MDTILSIYWWGVIAAFVFQLYSITMYLFGTGERLQYQRNLNRVGLSWDPLYFKIYNASDFKHTMLRYWWHTGWGFLECFLSWFSVCARIYRVAKLIPLCNQVDTMIFSRHGGEPWRDEFK